MTDISGQGIVEMQGAIPASVTITAYEENGDPKTSGGDLFFLHVEDLCYVTDNYRCDLSYENDKLPEVPIFTPFTDNGDGTYESEYVIQTAGTITVSAVLARQGGLYAEYFNNAFLDGVPAISRVESVLEYDWGEDLITEEAGDFVSIHWYGKLLAPYSEDFTFIIRGDDGFRFYFESELVIDRWSNCCDEMTITIPLTAGKLHDFRLEFRELQEVAYFKVEWTSPQIPRQVIPPQYLYYSERVGGAVYEVEVIPGPSISGSSTIEETETELTAGKLSQAIFQSRDSSGEPLDNTVDNYEMLFTDISNSGAGTFTVTAVYQENGRYLA